MTTTIKNTRSTSPRAAFPAAARLGLAGLCTAMGVVLGGCATGINPPPPVDILPTTPPTLAYPAPVVGPATGSLFRAASYRPAFEDRRARMVGDNVTVQIVENVTASQKSSSSTDRNSSVEAGITAFPFLKKVLTDKVTLGGSSNNTFAGKGGTESSNTFSGAITTTVVGVLPNGHLVIAGEKQIGVNQNVDVLRFSGTVDPLALAPNSVVSSLLVANVRVESRGRGQQAEALTTGWFSRFFSTVTPF